MYRAVIIYCLIVVGYAANVPVGTIHRETRKISPASTVTNYAQNDTQRTSFPYSTYPDYVTEKSVENVSATSPAVVPEKNSSFLSNMIFHLRTIASYGAHTSNYLLQILGAVLLGSSFVGLICSYTSICNTEIDELRNLARGYSSSPEFLNNFNDLLDRALNKYSKDKNA